MWGPWLDVRVLVSDMSASQGGICFCSRGLIWIVLSIFIESPFDCKCYQVKFEKNDLSIISLIFFKNIFLGPLVLLLANKKQSTEPNRHLSLASIELYFS